MPLSCDLLWNHPWIVVAAYIAASVAHAPYFEVDGTFGSIVDLHVLTPPQDACWRNELSLFQHPEVVVVVAVVVVAETEVAEVALKKKNKGASM